MGAFSSFVLPLIAGLGIYVLVLVLFPTVNSLIPLIFAIITAWLVKALLKKINQSLSASPRHLGDET